MRILDVNIISTFIFNFKYFPWKIALKFPVIFFGKVDFLNLRGKIILPEQIKLKPALIKFGNHSVGVFEKRMKTVLNIKGTVRFYGTADFGVGTSISVGDNSELVFGNNFMVTANSSIISTSNKNVSFGNNCLLSWDICIMNSDFHKIRHENKIINSAQDIIIGDDVWIGCRSTLLKGSIIPKGCVIGSNSLVCSKLNSINSVYVGSPVRVVKTNISWER